jgi:predicted transcriptional regulator
MTGKPTPIRLDDEIIGRVDRVAAGLAERASGVRVSRSEAMRVALEQGLRQLEHELEITVPKNRKR